MERAGLTSPISTASPSPPGPAASPACASASRRRAGIGLAAGKPVVGLTTLAAYAAPFIAADDTLPVAAAIDARHDHVYLQVFGPGGRTLVAPRLAPLREALRAAAGGAPRLVGNAAEILATAWPAGEHAAEQGRAARRARHRLGGAARRRRAGKRKPAQAALSARARRAAAGRQPVGAPMMGFFTHLFMRARAGAVGGERARRRGDRRACTPLRSGAAGASRKSRACCSTAP